MTNRDHLLQSSTVDKNGVSRTVYRKPDDATKGSRASSAPAPQLTADDRLAQLEEIAALIPEREGLSKFEYSPQMLDVAVATLAKYERDVPLIEVFEAEMFDDYTDADTVYYLRTVHREWYDSEAFINSADNLFGEGDNRQFERALAALVIKRGQPMGLGKLSNFSWIDPQSYYEPKSPIVGVYAVSEDRWNEFQGTFDDENEAWSYVAGVTAWVLYENGLTGKYRAEGDLTSMVRDLLADNTKSSKKRR